jgi:hypothetical protein
VAGFGKPRGASGKERRPGLAGPSPHP